MLGYLPLTNNKRIKMKKLRLFIESLLNPSVASLRSENALLKRDLRSVTALYEKALQAEKVRKERHCRDVAAYRKRQKRKATNFQKNRKY